MSDRFFYHCFPRPPHLVDGLIVLKSLCQNGLLLTPEELPVKLPHAQKPFSVFQRRICFTELASDELAKHSERFGMFSLKFSIDSLRMLGAQPAIYLPHPIARQGGLNATGGNVLLGVVQTYELLDRFRRRATQDREAHDLLNELTREISPPDVLAFALEALVNLYTFTENPRHHDEHLLEYYQQREWRIIPSFVYDNVAVAAKRLTDEQKEALLEMNSSFFDRQVTRSDGQKFRRVDECLYFSHFGGKPVMEWVSAVIAPSDKAAEVRALLDVEGLSIPVEVLPDSSNGMISPNALRPE